MAPPGSHSEPNQILSLARQVFEQRLTLDAVLRDHVPAMVTRGLPLTELIDAQLAAFQPHCPPLLKSHIAHICAEIAAKGKPADASFAAWPPQIAGVLKPAQIHLAAASDLDDHGDRVSLQLAVEHCRAARQRLAPDDDAYADALLQEGDARRRLAELGVDPSYNLRRAIEYAQQARALYAASSAKAGLAAMHEGIAHDLLAEGADRLEHLQTAARLYRHARTLFPPSSEDFAKSQVNEAATCVYLSELGVEPIATLKLAVRLCEDARAIFAAASHGCGLTLLNEANARRGLALWGEEPIDNLQLAVQHLHRAQRTFERSAYEWRLAVAGEAGARQELAAARVEPVDHLKTALALLISLEEEHVSGSHPHAERNIQEARARIDLARHGVTPELHLTTAMKLCQEARQGLDPAGAIHAQARTREGNARLQLALLGIRCEENCRCALSLFEESAQPYEPGSTNWAVARRNSGRALWLLGETREAYQYLESGLAVLDSYRADLRAERERIAFAEAVAGQYQDAAMICLDIMAQATDAEERDLWRWTAWHQIHRAKNRALLDLLQDARPRLDEQQQVVWEELEELRRQARDCARRIRLLRESLSGDATPAVQDELAALRDEHAALMKMARNRRDAVLGEIEGAEIFLGAEVPSAAEVHAEMRRLATRCGGEAQRSLLVELFVLDTGTVLVFLAPLWRTDVLEIEQISLPPGLSEGLARDLLAATGAGARGQSRDLRVESRRRRTIDLGRVVDQAGIFIEPWAWRLDEWQPTTLIFAPHSYLGLLPLHAAPVRGRPLIERFPVAYLPSPTLAASLLQKTLGKITSALLIGDPTGDLSGARAEVELAAAELAAAGKTVTCFSHHEATSDRVRAHGPAAGILHFACHSMISHDDFLGSGFLLHDRQLSVLEIMSSLALKNARLVYLSSCDSARPVIGRTEELMALARAFLYAGSPRVIASLWPLEDRAGRLFAELFYRAWLSGKPLIEAFQQAMLGTRDVDANPRSWAPFAMIGAW